MRRGILALGMAFGTALSGQGVLFESGFEEGWKGWKTPMEGSLGSRVEGDAHGGATFLRIRDESDTQGSEIHSEFLPVVEGRSYRLEFWARTETPTGAVFVRFLDEKNVELRPSQDKVLVAKGDWSRFEGVFPAPPRAVKAALYVRSFLKSKGILDFDDFRFEEAEVSPGSTAPLPEGPRRRVDLNHPRLLFDAEELVRLRKAIEEDPDRKVAARELVRRCDQILESADPGFEAAFEKLKGLDGKTHGAKSAWEGYFASADWAAEALAFAYALTGEPRYGRGAIRIMKVVAERQPLNRWPGFFYTRSFYLKGVSLVYDWCFALLSAEEKSLFRDSIAAWSRLFYDKAPREGWETWADNVLNQVWNWNAGISSALGIACLAIDGETDAPVRPWLFQAIRQVENYLRFAIDPKGAVIEGPAYFGYGAAPLPFFVEALRKGRGEDLFETTHYAKLVTFLPHETLPGGDRILNICDSSHRIDSWQAILYAMSRTKDVRNAASVWGAMGRSPAAVSTDNLVAYLLWGHPVAGKDSTPLPDGRNHAWAPWRGVMTGRTGWKKDDVMFSVHAQQCTLIKHDQADKGQVNFYGYGQDFLVDSGYGNDGDMSKSSGTAAHNLVLIDGKGQAGSSPQAYNDGYVRDHLASEAADFGRVDLRDAYEFHHGPEYARTEVRSMRRAGRHVLFARGSHPYLVVYDDLEQDGNRHSFSLLLHTSSSGSFAISNGSARIRSGLRDGRFEAMAVQSEGADANGAAFTSGAVSGEIVVIVDVPRAGRYQVHALTRSTGEDPERSDSIFFQVDGGKADFKGGKEASWFTWKTSTYGDAWTRLCDDNGGVAVPDLALSAGRHEFRFKTREPGAAILALYVAGAEAKESPMDAIASSREALLVTAKDFRVSGKMKVVPSGIALAGAEAFVKIRSGAPPSFRKDMFLTSREGSHPRLSVTVEARSPEFLWAVIPRRSGSDFDPAESARDEAFRSGEGFSLRLPDGTVDWAARAGEEGISGQDLACDGRFFWGRKAKGGIPAAWCVSLSTKLEWAGKVRFEASGRDVSAVWDGRRLAVSAAEIDAVSSSEDVQELVLNGIEVWKSTGGKPSWKADPETKRRISLAYRDGLY